MAGYTEGKVLNALSHPSEDRVAGSYATTKSLGVHNYVSLSSNMKLDKSELVAFKTKL